MLNFLGIGAQKAGTTWIFKRLSMHPNIYFPRGKEIHFWDGYSSLNTKSISHYNNIFRDQHFYKQNKFIVGEITPEYALLNDSQLNALHKYSPDVRIFYSLRDPADRAWSAIKMHLFLQQKDIKKQSVDDILELLENGNFIAQTEYAKNIKNWLQHFNKEQLAVVIFENFNSHPYKIMAKLSKHIGIDSSFYNLLPPAVIGGITFQGHKARMPEQIREKFVQRFSETTSEIEEYIKKPLPHWRKI